MGFPRICLFSLNFCIVLALVAVAISRGRLPRSPRPLLARPRSLSSSPACPGNTSRSPSLELFLPKVLTGCSRCPLGVYMEKTWQGLPSQQSPICSKRTERQPLSEGGVRYIRSQITWLASKALAPDFQTNTHLLKDEPRRKCEEGLRCGDLGVRRLFMG